LYRLEEMDVWIKEVRRPQECFLEFLRPFFVGKEPYPLRQVLKEKGNET
jgi:hypothetical protein